MRPPLGQLAAVGAPHGDEAVTAAGAQHGAVGRQRQTDDGAAELQHAPALAAGDGPLAQRGVPGGGVQQAAAGALAAQQRAHRAAVPAQLPHGLPPKAVRHGAAGQCSQGVSEPGGCWNLMEKMEKKRGKKKKIEKKKGGRESSPPTLEKPEPDCCGLGCWSMRLAVAR